MQVGSVVVGVLERDAARSRTPARWRPGAGMSSLESNAYAWFPDVLCLAWISPVVQHVLAQFKRMDKSQLPSNRGVLSC